jgi:hypothetical protein
MENEYERERSERILARTVIVNKLKEAVLNHRQVTKPQNQRARKPQLFNNESASISEPILRRSSRLQDTMTRTVDESDSDDGDFPEQVPPPLSTTIAVEFDKTMSALEFLTRYSEVSPDDFEETISALSATKMPPHLIVTIFKDLVDEGMLERGAVDETTTQVARLTNGRLELSTCHWLATAAKKVHKET